MKKSIFLMMMTALCAAASAETMSGRVTDAGNGAAMPYVTVSLMTGDSALVTGAISDEDGSFRLSAAAGTYVLRTSYVGYRTDERRIALPAGGPIAVTLSEERTEIAEVEVKARKPLVERKMDRIVMNVSASPIAAGSNGNELLRRAPGVNIDRDGNITVNGKSVEVYIDGRPSYLSGQQLRAMLEGTDGNTIEKIEIITNPSAKYDAAGSGGIINIRTKRNMTQGLNGTLSASYGGMWYGDVKRWTNQEFVSANINYRTAKTYTIANLTQLYQDMAVRFETEATTPDMKRASESEYALDFQYYMLKLGNDWNIDPKNTIGFILQAPVWKQRQGCPADRNFGYVLSGTDTTETSRSATSATTFAPQHTANLNYTHVFSDSLEREITVNLDYNRYNSASRNVQDNRYTLMSTAGNVWNGLDIRTSQIANIWSAKVDFQTQFWKTGMIETGVKYALSETGNHMETDSLTDGAVRSTSPSDFDYREHVAAAYITAGKQFGEHWSLKLGLRGEYTYSAGDWVSADSVTRRSYFDLFPTVFAGYTSKPLGKAGQPIMTSISYTRRIKRPNYYNMNPFRTYVDAHNYQTGNTELAPEFNNDVEVNFGYSQYLSLTFNFSHTQDMQQPKTEILPNGDGRMKWVNFGTCTTHGGNLSLTEIPIVPKMKDGRMEGAWLTLTANAGYFCFINREYAWDENGRRDPSRKYGDYYNKNHYYRFSGTLNAYLPANWTIMINADYEAPITIGYNYTTDQYDMSAGIRKMFPEKGVILNLSLQDALRSMQDERYSMGLAEGYGTVTRQDLRAQRLVFGVTWMFGTQQGHRRRKVGEMDESSRLGSGGM